MFYDLFLGKQIIKHKNIEFRVGKILDILNENKSNNDIR